MGSDRLFALFGKIALVLILLVAVSVVAFYLGAKNNQKQASLSQSYNQSSISPSETVSTEITSPTPAIDQTSVIRTAIKNALIDEHGSDASTLTITVSKIEGDYATGDASAQGGGGIWFAANINGVWKLVWDGNGSIQCSSLVPYPNFPTDMIPQCWDDKTQAVVKR